jgi:hypothetical protein
VNGVSEPSWMLDASFVVSLLTLSVLIWYAYLTRGIERAANEQSEGLSKPALTLFAIPRSPTIDENFTEILKRRMLTRAEPNANGCLEMVNIGNGPALRVRFEIRDIGLPCGKPWIGGAAYIKAGGALPLPLQGGSFIKGKQHKIVCYYDGLSGSHYEFVTELNGDEIEKWDFSRTGGP